MSDKEWVTVSNKSKGRVKSSNALNTYHSQSNDHQDWDTVILNAKKSAKAKGSQRVSNEKKAAPETNTKSGIPAWKVEQYAEEGSLVHKTINIDMRIQIQQARNAKGLSQKELARRTNLPLQTIQGYENGSIIPNGQELSRIKKQLGIN